MEEEVQDRSAAPSKRSCKKVITTLRRCLAKGSSKRPLKVLRKVLESDSWRRSRRMLEKSLSIVYFLGHAVRLAGKREEALILSERSPAHVPSRNFQEQNATEKKKPAHNHQNLESEVLMVNLCGGPSFGKATDASDD